MKQSILLIALAMILSTGCSRRVQKATLYRASGLNQSVSTSEAYYANLKLLQEYNQEIEDRCKNIPQVRSAFQKNNIKFPSYAGMLESQKRLVKMLPELEKDASYWKQTNRALISVESMLQITDGFLIKLEEQNK